MSDTLIFTCKGSEKSLLIPWDLQNLRGCSMELQYKCQTYTFNLKEAIQDKRWSTELQCKCQTYRIMEAIQDKGCSTELQCKCQTYRINLKEAIQDKGCSTELQYKYQTYRIKEATRNGCYKSLSLPQQKSLRSLSQAGSLSQGWTF